MNKQLADWIKTEEAQGYSEQQIRAYLTQEGYKNKDVEEAISSLKPVSGIKEFFKPTLLKLFFPILILILIILSLMVNFGEAQQIGKLFSDDAKLKQEVQQVILNYQDLIHKNNADPNQVIESTKNISLISFKQHFNNFEIGKQVYIPLRIGNIYLTDSKIYKINPFFPIPCESRVYMNTYNLIRCYNIISEEDYNFIITSDPKTRLLDENHNKYTKIDFIDLSINIAVLILLIYLFICALSLGLLRIKQKGLIEKLIVFVFLLILPLLLTAISEDGFFMFTYIFSLIYGGLIFLKDNKLQKIILYSLAGLTILGLIIGFFIVKVTLTLNLHEPKIQNEAPYTIKYCTNTKILTNEEKQEVEYNIYKKYLSEEWNVCYNPSCSKICRDFCEGKRNIKIMQLRGDKPSCICGCG